MRTLSFLCGMVIGVFALLILQNLGLVRFGGRLPHAATVEVRDAGAAEPGRGVHRDQAAEDELSRQLAEAIGDPRGGKGLEPLAIALEEAIFERDWARVQAIATLVRKRGGAWTSAPSAVVAVTPKTEESLYDQASEVKRKLDEERLANRRNRATALADKTDRASIDELVSLLETSDSDTERADAAWLIAKSGDEAGIRELVKDLRSDSERIRAPAGAGLAKEDVLAGAAEAAQILRTDPSVDLRKSAVECLAGYDAVQHGNVEHQALRPFLDALAKDDSDRVRASAAHELGRCDLRGARELRSALYDVIERDDSARVRAEAVASLLGSSVTLGVPEDADDHIERAIRIEKSPEVQAVMIDFLDRFGDDGAVPALDELAAQPVARPNADRIAAARQSIIARLDAARR